MNMEDHFRQLVPSDTEMALLDAVKRITMNDDELKYGIGVDQCQWDDKGIPFDSSKFKWDKSAIKAWGKAAEDPEYQDDPKQEEPVEPKKYWGKALNELTDEQLDNVVWGANLYPSEEREEILAEIKLRALKRGIALQEAAV